MDALFLLEPRGTALDVPENIADMECELAPAMPKLALTGI